MKSDLILDGLLNEEVNNGRKTISDYEREGRAQAEEERHRYESAAGDKKKGNAEKLPLSDYTNALIFIRDHGKDIRYCFPWAKWLVWDGKRWDIDSKGEVMRRAKQTIKKLAGRAETIEEDIKIKAFLKHIKSSLSAGRLKAMTELSQSEEEIPILPEELDRHPWALNCQNGTVNLQTGELQPHQRKDFLTRILPVVYDPEASCPTWLDFLHRIMQGRQDIICFLQKAVGYSLSGDISEQVFFILWGTGANGKSTLINAILEIMGPFAMKATSDLLLVSRGDRHPTERADLAGKRIVATIETEEGRLLAESFIKEATGGDPIRARRMREDFWEFLPTHKIWLATNHKPIIRGTDGAIWRRPRLIPFEVAIPEKEQDKKLPEKLRKEYAGILAWAVEGCLAWQKEGLGYPEGVKKATENYRSEMDILGDFIDECCEVGESFRAKASTLYGTYKEWCQEVGECYKNQRTWGRALTERGFERYSNNGTWYRRIGIRETQFTEGTEGTEPFS